MYAIQQIDIVVNKRKNGVLTVNLLSDPGSDATLVTFKTAKACNAVKCESVALQISTINTEEKRIIQTHIYSLSLVAADKSIKNILAYGVNEISSKVAQLDLQQLKILFPTYPVEILQRLDDEVQILLGADHQGYQPMQHVQSAGEHLFILTGILGPTILGSHPTLSLNNLHARGIVDLNPSSRSCNVIQHEVQKLDSFIYGEELAYIQTKKCQACARCTRCPTLATLSFKEMHELHLIEENVAFNEELGAWQASYAWTSALDKLPSNYKHVYSTLLSTERSLRRNPAHAACYSQQIQELLTKGYARKLDPVEIASYSGPIWYVSHLGVISDSKSTPLRFCINSAQVCDGVSLNNLQLKGPDPFLNNLLGLLIRWREFWYAYLCDLRKMFYSILLNKLEEHMHRFLWRDCDPSRTPDVLALTRPAMGDKISPALASICLRKTAERHEEEYPRAAHLIKNGAYMDDISSSCDSMEEVNEIIQEAEALLSADNFEVKCWQVSYESQARSSDQANLLKTDGDLTKFLGVGWKPSEDTICQVLKLNFSKKKAGRRTEAKVEQEDFNNRLPDKITRRIALEQVQAVFDPLGLLSAWTIVAKKLLKDTWIEKLDWDDALSSQQSASWVSYFEEFYTIRDLKLPRCTKPFNATEEPPRLVIFSDASMHSYASCAYIHWHLKDGSYESRLLMARSRIAPMANVSIVRLELNGAVLNKRLREIIVAETRYKFIETYQIVDSAIVLAMLNNTSSRFHIYESNRISEIQSATQGNMDCWYWVAGTDNVADLATRGCSAGELTADSIWFTAPPFMKEHPDKWPLKQTYDKNDALPGSKDIKVKKDIFHINTNLTTDDQLSSDNLSEHEDIDEPEEGCKHCINKKAKKVKPKIALTDMIVDMDRCKTAKRARHVVARVVNILRTKSFYGSMELTPEAIRAAEIHIHKCVQQHLNFKRDYKQLKPVRTAQGIYVCGGRLVRKPENEIDMDDCQVLLPYKSRWTELLMKESHEACGHKGQDATLAHSRDRFWISRGRTLASSTSDNCYYCIVKRRKALQQQMGLLPLQRTRPSVPFTEIGLDFFGPLHIRGTVKARTTKKVYCLVIADMTSRAVHMELSDSMSTDDFLLAFRAYTAIRGFPMTCFSDRGSNLVEGSGIIKDIWDESERRKIVDKAAEHGTKWHFSPAESPHCNGVVESMVKACKAALLTALGEQVCTLLELRTFINEASNIVNSRPLGTLPGDDSNINVLTPNMLLLGRSNINNPGTYESTSMTDRMLVIEYLTKKFWKAWNEHFKPELTRQRKWKTPCRGLRENDVVMLLEETEFVSEYRLGRVKKVVVSDDGLVRSCVVAYKNFKAGEPLREYSGVKDTEVTRSVHKLSLLAPADQLC